MTEIVDVKARQILDSRTRPLRSMFMLLAELLGGRQFLRALQPESAKLSNLEINAQRAMAARVSPGP